MANNIKGITVEINGETGPLDKALKGVNNTSRDLQKELREVEKGLKLDPSNTVLLAQKQELLAKSITNTKDKLGTLKIAEEQAQQQFANGRISEEQYRALQREVINTEQSLERLERQAIQSNAVLSKDEAVGNLKNIAAAAGVATVAIGGALVGAAVKAAQSADDINTLSKQTGLATDTIQKFQFASDRIDVSLETLTGSMAKLTKNMSSAKDGSKSAEESFAKLGITYKDKLTGELRDNEDVFNDAITALGKMTNETERDALAMELFGKSAQDLNPLILGGADALKTMGKEAEDAGLILSQETLDSANALGDSIDAIKAVSAGIFAKIGSEVAEKLLPILNLLLQTIKSLPIWIQQNSTLLITLGIVIGTVTALVIAFNVQQALLASGMTLWGSIAGIGTTITTGLGTAMTFLLSPIALVILAIGALIAIFILAWKNIDGFKETVLGAWDFIQSKTKQVFQDYIMPFIRDQLMPLFQKVFSTIGDVVKGTFTLMGWAWDNILKPIFTVLLAYIQNILLPTWKLIFSAISGSVSSVFSTIGALWNTSLKPIFNGILDFISGVFTGNWKKAWQGVVSVFSGVWEGMKAIAKAPINFIIGGLNGFISGINKIQIPDWVPGVGGKGINIPSIPSFSVGTKFLPKDMLIQAHAGEMIVPKSENPYANSNGKIMPDNNKAPVTLQLVLQNGKAIAEFIVDDLDVLIGNKNKINGRSVGIF